MIKTTLLGGFLLLLPVGLLVFLLGKAYSVSLRIVEPLRALFPFERVGSIAVADLLAVAAIVGVCFLCGLALRFAPVARTGERLDQLFEAIFPQFAVAKMTIRGVGGLEAGHDGRRTVIVHLDDNDQIAIEMERIGDRVLVFVPGSPNAWIGSTMIVAANRVEPTRFKPHRIAALMRTFGRGTLAALAEPDGPAD